MPTQLDGIHLKLSRALEQIKVFNAECSAFLKTDPYVPEVHFDTKTRILTIFVGIERAPNPMWGVHVGEIVHDMRSALDHLVWELVILTTGRPPALPTKNQFPIFKKKDGFKERGIDQQLRCVRQDAVDLIQNEQPFSKGDYTKDALWHLSELSNCDKHRTLHVTGTLVQAFHFDFGSVIEPIEKTDLLKMTTGPIQKDAVLYRCHLTGKLDWPFSSRDVKGHLVTNIAFDQATPSVGGWIATTTLIDIEKRVRALVTLIAKDIFKIDFEQLGHRAPTG